MNIYRLIVTFSFIQMSYAIPLEAQVLQDPNLLNKITVGNINQVYFDEIGESAQIYHGTEYIREGRKIEGFPYYESNEMLTGCISYQGIIYPKKSLFFDLISDRIIINNFNNSAQIVLSFEKVDSFEINGHLFVKLSLKNFEGLPRDGYYEVLYPGRVQLIAKREKKIISSNGNEETKYIQYNSYYIKNKSIYQLVDGKTSLLTIFKDRQDDLKRFIRANKLNFKKTPEFSFIRSTAYYCQLNR